MKIIIMVVVVEWVQARNVIASRIPPIIPPMMGKGREREKIMGNLGLYESINWVWRARGLWGGYVDPCWSLLNRRVIEGGVWLVSLGLVLFIILFFVSTRYPCIFFSTFCKTGNSIINSCMFSPRRLPVSIYPYVHYYANYDSFSFIISVLCIFSLCVRVRFWNVVLCSSFHFGIICVCRFVLLLILV